MRAPIMPMDSLERKQDSAANNPGQAKRPKVKTGCHTCRRRHVKCDETRPSCLRCLKYKGVCEGYIMPANRYGTSTRPLVPKTKTSLSSTQYSLFPSGASIPGESALDILMKDPKQSLFRNDREYQCFRFFCNQTATRLSGANNSHMWTKTVLQACESQPILRHAVVAIGALDLSLEAQVMHKKEITFFKTDTDGRTHEERHQFALQQYGTAITRLREFITRENTDMRTTILACLLFVCFEAFHGNSKSALAHAQSGLRMIQEWMPKRVDQSVIHEKYLSGMQSPSPYDLDDELLEAFIRLDITALTFANQTPDMNEPKITPGIDEVCRFMPKRFANIEEAKNYWYIVWRDTMIFVRMTGPSPIYKRGIQICGPSIPFQHLASGPREKHEDRRMALKALCRWSAAFRPIFEQSRKPQSKKNFVLASTMELQFRVGYISICGYFEDELYYDDQISHYKEMLSLAEEIRIQSNSDKKSGSDGASKNRAAFVFDGPVIGSVYTVALQCREPATRRRAIKWLKAEHRREGIWDSLLSATVATIVMEIEEKGMVDGRIPLSARLKEVQTKFNLLERRGHLQYKKMALDSGRYKVKEMVFGW